MTVYRSYFKKNNTLIENNLTNNSQNPVTEISYGTEDGVVSRFIFDVNFIPLLERVSDGIINSNRIVKHILCITNTIRYAEQYIGRKSYDSSIMRASSFDLELFNIKEDWDEGSGYDFTFGNIVFPVIPEQASNWEYRKTNDEWSVSGAYISGVSENIGNQRFEVGNEDIEIDITNYVNQRLFSIGNVYSGDSFGLGIKFPNYLENLITLDRQAVAFHAKMTNTFYEPYIETIVDDTITDDRNYFYLDKDNELYLYVNIGGFPQNITINYVNIFDNEDNLIYLFSGTSIENVSKGIYKVQLNISSEEYPDAILFRDVWNVTINGRDSIFENEFYLISESNYYVGDLSSQINTNNYHFNFWGISENEHIVAGDIKKINILIKEFYPNQNKFLPLDIEYRIFTTIGRKYELDIVPFTKVNRTRNGYMFNIDTSWLIPQDYFLQIRMKNGNFYENKQILSFVVVSNKLIPK